MRIIDAFCGAGGAFVGYMRAGFAGGVGVDLDPQPRFPGPFEQWDALAYIETHWREYDAIHASPPCQTYSAMSACRPGLSASYNDLIGATREVLRATGLPYVIENVPGSPLIEPVWLCGQMFGRELYRHRGFETNWPLEAPAHPPHVMPASKAGHWTPGTVMSVAGHVAPISKAREIMGIDWMTRAELGEAIPPAYTECVGRQLMRHIENARG